MAVFRVERNKGYTVMSNYHLRDKSLSLKAKGLLSQMLSLPDGWDYTLKGLAIINREQIDAIREAVRELERAGYLVRTRERDEKGRYRGNTYVIYEQPVSKESALTPPTLENSTQEVSAQVNPTQINIDITSKEELNKERITIDSFSSDTSEEMKRKESLLKSIEIYKEIIKEKINYDALAEEMPYEQCRLDEIVELIVETVCSGKKYIRVAGTDLPAEVVKSRLMKLNMDHIRFVFECLKENTTKIRNIKQYLLAALYNAPITIENYYSAQAQYDLFDGYTY